MLEIQCGYFGTMLLGQKVVGDGRTVFGGLDLQHARAPCRWHPLVAAIVANARSGLVAAHPPQQLGAACGLWSPRTAPMGRLDTLERRLLCQMPGALCGPGETCIAVGDSSPRARRAWPRRHRCGRDVFVPLKLGTIMPPGVLARLQAVSSVGGALGGGSRFEDGARTLQVQSLGTTRCVTPGMLLAGCCGAGWRQLASPGRRWVRCDAQCGPGGVAAARLRR